MKSGQLSVKRVEELHSLGHVGCDLQSPARVQHDAAVLVQDLKENTMVFSALLSPVLALVICTITDPQIIAVKSSPDSFCNEEE